MQNPQAINITRNPPIKNKRELSINMPCSGTYCAAAGTEVRAKTPNRVIVNLKIDINASVSMFFLD